MICEKDAFWVVCWLDFWLCGATHPLPRALPPQPAPKDRSPLDAEELPLGQAGACWWRVAPGSG